MQRELTQEEKNEHYQYYIDCAKVCINSAQGYEFKDIILQNFNDAIDTCPDQVQAYIERGDFYFENWKYEKAVEDYQRALILEPNNISLRIKLANAHGRNWSADDHTYINKAHSEFTKAIELETDPVETAKLILLRANTTQINIAEDYHKAFKLAPENTFVCIEFANYHLDNKNFEKAMELFNKAISLEPKNASHYIDRGNCFNKQNNFAAALQDYSQAIQFEPNNISHYQGRIGLYYRNIDKKIKNDLAEKEILMLLTDACIVFRSNPLNYISWEFDDLLFLSRLPELENRKYIFDCLKKLPILDQLFLLNCCFTKRHTLYCYFEDYFNNQRKWLNFFKPNKGEELSRKTMTDYFSLIKDQLSISLFLILPELVRNNVLPGDIILLISSYLLMIDHQTFDREFKPKINEFQKELTQSIRRKE